MLRSICVALVVTLAGCSTVASQTRPDSYYPQTSTGSSTDTSALFKSDGSVIADEDIKRILDHRYLFPKQNRIAILPLGQRAWWSTWSNEFAVLNAEKEESFIKALRSSSKIYDASYLPSIVVPEKRTIPYLREAAARYQADLLLLYRADCKTFEKYRVFSANETKAYCTVETVLLDTRLGIIPFTSVTTEAFEAKKSDEDSNFTETIRKAEIENIGKGLLTSAQRLVAFMDASGK
jgi:hypothetical protein